MLASIIITSYNYEKYIEECINSCLSQKKVNDFEVIIIDDGSTDNTQAIIKKYTSNPKVRMYINKNQGIEYSSNFGINRALGKYILRVDADDVIHDDFLFRTLEAIDKQKVAFVYSNYSTINEHSESIKEVTLPTFSKEELLVRGDFLATGTLYERKALEDIGLYNEKTKNCGLENYEVILKLLNKAYLGYHLNETLFLYRRHNNNMSEIKRNSIISYGRGLFKNLKLGQYQTNKNHPYGLIVND